MGNTSSKFGKLLSSIREHSSLFGAFEDGATPDDIKRSVIELLSPYFTDQSTLESLAVNALMGDAFELGRLSKDKLSFDLFEHSINIHQQAKARNTSNSLKACAKWLPAIYEGLSVFWSQLHLELDKSTLELEEFTHECLRNMGSVLEGSVKPVAKELLHQLRISQGASPAFRSIDELDFGNMIHELHRASPSPSFFAPWGIRLNQWRNIAQHFSARIEGKEIVCWYGRPGNEREIRLTQNELIAVVKRAFDIFSSLRLANRLFFIDNLCAIQASDVLPSDIKVRPEAMVLNFVAAMASQGFEVMDFQNNDQGAKVIIRDVTTLDPNQRRFHTVQFVGVLWSITQAPVVTVEYHERDGTPNFRTCATRDIFERIKREGLEPSTIAEEAELADLKTGQVIPRILKNEKR